MRSRLAAGLICAWAPIVPALAQAATLATITPTTAASAQLVAPLQFVGGTPLNIPIQCNFTYGSGGTSTDAWIQTTFDGGATWIDVANCHFTTSSARFTYNLSSLTPVTTEYTPGDGALSANTSKDGQVGQSMRVKWTSVGTYAATTLVISVDVQSLK